MSQKKEVRPPRFAGILAAGKLLQLLKQTNQNNTIMPSTKTQAVKHFHLGGSQTSPANGAGPRFRRSRVDTGRSDIAHAFRHNTSSKTSDTADRQSTKTPDPTFDANYGSPPSEAGVRQQRKPLTTARDVLNERRLVAASATDGSNSSFTAVHGEVCETQDYLQRRMEILQKKRDEIIKKGLNKKGKGCSTSQASSNRSNKFAVMSRRNSGPISDSASGWCRCQTMVCGGGDRGKSGGRMPCKKVGFGEGTKTSRLTRNCSTQADGPKPNWKSPFDRLKEFIFPKDYEYQSNEENCRNNRCQQEIRRQISDPAFGNMSDAGGLCEKIIVYKKYKTNSSDAGGSCTSESSQLRDFQQEEEPSFQERGNYQERDTQTSTVPNVIHVIHNMPNVDPNCGCPLDPNPILQGRSPDNGARKATEERKRFSPAKYDRDTQTSHLPTFDPNCGCPPGEAGVRTQRKPLFTARDVLNERKLVAASGTDGSNSPVSVKVFVGRGGADGRCTRKTSPLQQTRAGRSTASEIVKRRQLGGCRCSCVKMTSQVSNRRGSGSSHSPHTSAVFGKNLPPFSTDLSKSSPESLSNKRSSQVLGRDKYSLRNVSPPEHSRPASAVPSDWDRSKSQTTPILSRTYSLEPFDEGRNKTHLSLPGSEHDLSYHPSEMFSRYNSPNAAANSVGKNASRNDSKPSSANSSKPSSTKGSKPSSTKGDPSSKNGSKPSSTKGSKTTSKNVSKPASRVESSHTYNPGEVISLSGIEEVTTAIDKQSGSVGSRYFRVPCEKYKSRGQLVLPGPIHRGKLRHSSRFLRRRYHHSVSDAPSVGSVKVGAILDQASSSPRMDYNSTRSSRRKSRKSSIKVLHKKLWGI